MSDEFEVLQYGAARVNVAVINAVEIAFNQRQQTRKLTRLKHHTHMPTHGYHSHTDTTGSVGLTHARAGLHKVGLVRKQCPNKKGKGKGFPYSILSVGSGADPGVQAVSPQVTVRHPPGGRLPLLSARPAVTSTVAQHNCSLADTKLFPHILASFQWKVLLEPTSHPNRDCRALYSGSHTHAGLIKDRHLFNGLFSTTTWVNRHQKG